MIKSIKLKFTSTNKKSIARFQRSFFMQFSTFVFISDHFASSRFVSIYSSLTSRNVRILFSFFFRVSGVVRILFMKNFCVAVIFCVVVVFCVVISFFAIVFAFLFHSRNCSRRFFSQSQNRWRYRSFFQLLTTKKQLKTIFTSINQNMDLFDKIHFCFKTLHSYFLLFIN